MPMTNPIMSMFARSPIRPLQEHISKVEECAKQLIPFFEAVIAEDWDRATKAQGQISAIEEEADELKKALRLQLPRGLFMPVQRTDLLNILLLQDRIANRAKDIAGLILGRKMVLPENIQKSYMTFLHRCLDAVNQAVVAIEDLDNLIETGFRGHEVDNVEKVIVGIDSIEAETDAMQIKIRSDLATVENKLSPINVMFLYKIIELTGDLADRAQTVGGNLQLLLAR